MTKIRKINRPWPKSNQFWRWSGYIRIRFPENAWKPKFDLFMPCTVQLCGLMMRPPWSQTSTQQGLSKPTKPINQALTLINPSTKDITTSFWHHKKLDTSTARRHLKSPQSLSGTSAHPNMVTLVNNIVMNGWLTCILFVPCQSAVPFLR